MQRVSGQTIKWAGGVFTREAGTTDYQPYQVLFEMNTRKTHCVYSTVSTTCIIAESTSSCPLRR